MKNLSLILVVLVSALVGFAGCGSKKTVDTSKLESSFSAAAAPVKADVQKVVDLVKAQDFAGALAQLQKVNVQAGLTQDQKDAIKGVVENLQKLIAEGANKSVEKAAGETTKALKDLPKK